MTLEGRQEPGVLKDEALLLLFLIEGLLLGFTGTRGCDVLSFVTLIISSLTDILGFLLSLSVHSLAPEDLGDVEGEKDGGAQHDGDKD